MPWHAHSISTLPGPNVHGHPSKAADGHYVSEHTHHFNRGVRYHAPVQTDVDRRRSAWVLDNIREHLKEKKSDLMKEMSWILRQFDHDKDGLLQGNEFREFVRDFQEFGCLREGDADIVFAAVDVDGTGSVSPQELIRALCGTPNARRQALLSMAFDSLDKDGDGALGMGEMLTAYEPNYHPDVKRGKKTAEAALKAFILEFDVGGVSNGKVTRDQFIDRYTATSLVYESDEEFEKLIRATWQIAGQPSIAAPRPAHQSKKPRVARPASAGANRPSTVVQAPLRVEDFMHKMRRPSAAISEGVPASNAAFARPGRDSQVVDIGALINRIRCDLKNRGKDTIASLQRKFRRADANQSKTLCRAEFEKMCQDCQFGLSQKEVNVLWVQFDCDGSGEISYEEFLKQLHGEMPASRQAAVEKAFRKTDKDGSGCFDVNELLSNYDASQHPDVKAGTRTPVEVLKALIVNFDIGGVPDGNVSWEEFLTYYEGMSAGIDDDAYFFQMVSNVWRLNE